MSHDTVGAAALELMQKELATNDPIEIQREAQKDYIDNLSWTVRHMQKKVDCSHLIGTSRGHETCPQRQAYFDDFFVVVVCKKEKLMQNVLRNYFMGTLSCPTPDYDQSVYHYHAKDEKLEYLWTVPDKETCEAFKNNIMHVIPEEHPLLSMVMSFYDGTLMKQARRLNGEDVKKGIILEGN